MKGLQDSIKGLMDTYCLRRLKQQPPYQQLPKPLELTCSSTNDSVYNIFFDHLNNSRLSSFLSSYQRLAAINITTLLAIIEIFPVRNMVRTKM